MNTSEQNYQLIRKTAMELFREKGFDEVTVKDICDAAGVPRRSYYSLFQNKDELILSYFDLNQELYSGSGILNELLLLNDPYSKLLALVRFYITLLEKNGRHFLSQIYRIGVQNGETTLFDIAAAGMKDLSSQLIGECQKDGSIRNMTSPDLLWESLTTFLIGIAYVWCCKEPFPLEETAMSRFEDIVDAKPELRQYHNDTLYLLKEN
jgi:AcrR family transcriptional regulator